MSSQSPSALGEVTRKPVAAKEPEVVSQHIVEFVSDSGEGAQTAGQMFGIQHEDRKNDKQSQHTRTVNARQPNTGATFKGGHGNRQSRHKPAVDFGKGVS